MFWRWQYGLGEDIELYALQLPGRRERIAEPLVESLEEVLLSCYQILSTLLDLPLVLFGHSLGGLIAFELAARLEDECDISVSHLIVAGRGAPFLPSRFQPISALSSAEFWSQIHELGGIPEGIAENDGVKALLEPAIRADFAIAERYMPNERGRVKCNLSAWGGVDDILVPLDDLRAWRQCTSGRPEVCMFEGNHFFIHSAEDEILHALRRTLDNIVV
jgi:medium-chain acyl-[acyl-carrier-protein] hydrolase